MKKYFSLPDSLKVILIQLNDKSVYAGYKRNLTKRTPLGLAYIAASLISAGHSVEIVDAALDDLNVNQIIKITLDRNPHLVGITATTPLFPQLVEVIKGVKNENENIYFVIGGPHSSSLPEISLASSDADCVCIGEGERSIVELIDSL